MADPTDFIGTKKSASGAVIMGPLLKGPLFIHPTLGIIFEDRDVAGDFYRIVIASGNLTIEQVTI